MKLLGDVKTNEFEISKRHSRQKKCIDSSIKGARNAITDYGHIIANILLQTHCHKIIINLILNSRMIIQEKKEIIMYAVLKQFIRKKRSRSRVLGTKN